MRIAIVGSGNAGCAHAYILAKAGHEINLLKTSKSLHDSNFAVVKQNGGIWCCDTTNSTEEYKFQSLNIITRDPSVALEGVEVILVMVQSIYHESVAKMLIPHISDSVRLLLVIPGNLGSLFFRKELLKKEILIGEGESMPYDCRIESPGYVKILFRNVRNALSFIPSVDNERGLDYAKKVFDTYIMSRKNILESALHNPNLIVHTTGTIMSASRIEFSKGEFWLYKEGFTPSIWNIIKELDKEKNNVIEKYGGVPIDYLDDAKWRNEENLDRDSYEVFKSYKESAPKGPASVDGRYLVEDVQNGLVILSSFGRLAGIKTPVADSLICIASALIQQDFMTIGRTAKSLNIDSYNEALSL